MAVPGRAPPAGPHHPSPRGRRLSPSPTEDAPPGTPTATRDGLDHPVGPPPASNSTSPLHRPRWPPQGGRDHLGTDDSSRALVSGQARHGNTFLTGPGFLVSRPTDAQRSIPHAGVVGHDGAPSLDDGVPFSQEALLHSL